MAAAGARRRSTFRRTWTKARTAVGLPDLHFHDLHHTGNTMAAGQDASLRELMERRGHTSPRAALICRTRQGAKAFVDPSCCSVLIGLMSGDSSGKPTRADARPTA